MWRAPLARLALAFAGGVFLAIPPGGRFWFVTAGVLLVSAAGIPRGGIQAVSLRPLARSLWMMGVFASIGHLRTHAALDTSVFSDGSTLECVGTSGRSRGRAVPVYSATCRSVSNLVAAELLLPYGSAPPHAGSKVRFSGEVQRPGRQRNPGGFDAWYSLRRRGLHTQVAVSRWSAVPSARSRFAASVSRRLAVDPTGLVAALVVGDRRRLSSDLIDQFRRAGLAHLLALSGLHVAFVAFLMYVGVGGILARTGFPWMVRQSARVCVTVFFLGMYAWITGSSPSVVRAVVMCALLLARPLARRASTDPWNTLGAAACALLWFRPFDLLDVGFLLSFVAVASLIVFANSWSRAAQFGIVRFVRASMIATWSVTLGTLPLVLVVFGRVPVASLLLNVPAIPLAAAIVGGGMAGLALPNPAAAAALSGASVCARWLGTLAEFGATLPAIHPPASLAIGVAALLVLSTLLVHRRARRTVAALAFLLLWLPIPKDAALDVLVLDVGQGDAVLVRFPSGRTLLVDTGPPGSAARIRGVLRELDIGRLDAVVVTHPHDDHDGSLGELMAMIPVGRVYDGTGSSALRAGDRLVLDKHTRVQVLAPDGGAYFGANDHSTVLRIAFGSTSFLLTGDVERPGEQELVLRFGRLLISDVIKVPHHGSRTSSTPALVQAATTGTTHAVISVGPRNRYRLPGPEVVSRWKTAGARVLRTDLHGAVWFRSDGHSVTQQHWR